MKCKICGGYVDQGDTTAPNIHYSAPPTICYSCERIKKAGPDTMLQDADGTYYKKRDRYPEEVKDGC